MGNDNRITTCTECGGGIFKSDYGPDSVIESIKAKAWCVRCQSKTLERHVYKPKH